MFVSLSLSQVCDCHLAPILHLIAQCVMSSNLDVSTSPLFHLICRSEGLRWEEGWSLCLCNHGEMLSVSVCIVAVEIATLTRVDGATKIAILGNEEVAALIKEFEAKEEEAKKAEEKKRQQPSSSS